MTTLKIIEDSKYPQQIKEIRKKLEKYMESKMLSSFDGYQIYCESYKSDNNSKSIVISHGFTEFTKKYSEMIWYLFNAGFDVYIYDQRGHGLSQRQVENIHLSHIDRFEDYSDDLKYFIENYVVPQNNGKPIYLFGQSMGGSVCILYLQSCNIPIKAAILSSPMISPITPIGIPKKSILNMINKDAQKYGWTSKFRYAGEFRPNASFEKSSDTCYERFKDNLDIRIDNPLYQNSSSTNRWTYEAITIKKKLLDKKSTANIKPNILLISADKDKVVSNFYQRKFAKLLSNCRFIRLKDVKHSVFTSKKEKLEIYYRHIFEFLNEN